MTYRKLLVAAWLVLSVITASAVTRPCRASDEYNRNWPHWRGPAQNGLVLCGDPPLEWSEDKNIKWKLPIPGRGNATPIIWDDKVFVLTAVPADDDSERLAFTVLCLDRETGQTRWERVARVDAPHQEIQPTNSYSSGSPVTDGKHLVVSFGSYGLYCYDLDGDLLWERDVGKVDVTWGEGSSPALAGDVVVVVQDNNEESFLYGFDVRTGNQLWKVPRNEGSSWTTPYVHTENGQTQVIVNGANAVRSYDPRTGAVLWQCSGLGVNVTPMVVVEDGVVYAMSGQRTSPAAMAIRLGGTGDLTNTDAVLWKQSRGTPYVASPLLYDGRLYFIQHVTSILSCLEAVTGEPHYLQRRLDGITNIYASPIGVNDRVYVVGREGTTLVVENEDELKVLARNELDEGCDASPAVVVNELFLRGSSHLYCIAED